ncbi:MAG: ABC transporter permease [Desulfobulbaceae bacterium]|nr:ABC transporter permease [Desulfobulbaceae bacterium]
MLFEIIIGIISAAIPLSITFVLVGIGEMFNQRAGVYNLGAEGIMMVGAFLGFYVEYVMQSGPGSSFLGMLAAIAVGALMGGIMALVCVKFKAEQGIAGIALYMLGWGIAGMLFRVYIGGTTSIVGLKAVDLPLLTDIPVLGPLLFSHNVMVYITLLIVPFSWYLLNKTAWGLKVKAVGTAPRAADTMGVKVDRTRIQCVMLAGAMAGLAGAYLSICQTHMYADNITAGRGFIAVALVYFGKWKPSGILFGALLFSLAHSFQRSIQVYGIDFPYEIAVVFPYLLVIVVLALSGRSNVMAPAVLGKPYYRELRD